jgi:hypothetical protein
MPTIQCLAGSSSFAPFPRGSLSQEALFWFNQKMAYDLPLKIAWQTVHSFVKRDPKLKGNTGAHAVLHTHSRRLAYHPHVHLIVPAGAINKQTKHWRRKDGSYLFKEKNLAKVFRAKLFEALRRLGWSVKAALPSQWVVDCKAVGTGRVCDQLPPMASARSAPINRFH